MQFKTKLIQNSQFSISQKQFRLDKLEHYNDGSDSFNFLKSKHLSYSIDVLL